MNILICDDEPKFLDTVRDHVQEYMNTRYIGCNIVATSDPLAVFQGKDVYDLAFLDIQMDEVDGLTLAKELRRRNKNLALFFITNFENYQDDALDMRALRFFKKPFDTVRLHAGLDRAIEYIDGAYVDVFLSSGAEQVRIPADDILYITRANRRILLVTKVRTFQTKETLDAWKEKLPQLFFYPVHKSFLVNLHHVSKYTYSELTLTDGSRVPIAPSKQVAFRKFWFLYLGGRHL